MKADLYVQGHFWATIDVPGDSLLALLCTGIIGYAQGQTDRLKQDFERTLGLTCTISLRAKLPITYEPSPDDQTNPPPQENKHDDPSPLPLVPPAPTPHS